MPLKVVCLAQPYYRLHGSHNNRLHLGLHYLAEVLKREGVDASVYNGDFEPGDEYADWPSIMRNAWNWSSAVEHGHPLFWEIAQSIAQLAPDVVIIAAGETVTPTLNNGSVRGAARLAQAMKRLMPDLKVIGYGPQFTFAEVVPPEIDYVLRFEGEAKLAGCEYSTVGRLVRHAWGDGDQRVWDGGLVPKEQMDDLPFLDPETVDVRTRPAPHDLDYISGSRGCLFTCHYCLVPNFAGKTRYMSPERYVAEMEHRYKRYGVTGLYFCDQTFTENKARLQELMNTMCDRSRLPPEFKWWAEARVETLDPAMYWDMHVSGCSSLKIGIEAGDPEMLSWFGKKTNLDRARDKIRKLKEFDIKPVVYVLLGTPGVTRENYLRSLEFMRSLEAQYYVVNITTAARGTKMFDKVRPELEAAGLYRAGEEEGFGHLSQEMRKFWNLDDDIVDLFFGLVKGSDKEDAALRKYRPKLLTKPRTFFLNERQEIP